VKRLMIVADNSLIVDAIAIGLRKSGEFNVLGHIDPQTACEGSVAEMDPEVVLLDDMGQSPQVIELIRKMKAGHPGVEVIVLTLSMEPQWLDELFDAGAISAISKATHPGALTTLVRETLNGHVVHVSKGLARNHGSRINHAALEGTPLTPRELEVLQLVASGSSNGEIAQSLWITEQTVKFHLSNVYRKLEVANRTEASHYAYVNGLVAAPQPVETP
jgi:DNA-binding NarL/FixJ family response regulator